MVPVLHSSELDIISGLSRILFAQDDPDDNSVDGAEGADLDTVIKIALNMLQSEFSDQMDRQKYSDILIGLMGGDMNSHSQIQKFYDTVINMNKSRKDINMSVRDLLSSELRKGDNAGIFSDRVQEMPSGASLYLDAPVSTGGEGGDYAFMDQSVLDDDDSGFGITAEDTFLEDIGLYSNQIDHEEVDKIVQEETDKLKQKFIEEFGHEISEDVGGEYSLDVSAIFGEDFAIDEYQDSDVAKLINKSSIFITSEVERRLELSSKYFNEISEEVSPISNDRCQVCNDKIDTAFKQLNALISIATKEHERLRHPSTNRILFVLRDIKDKFNRSVYESLDVRKRYDKDPSSTSWRPVCLTNIPIVGILSSEGLSESANVSEFKSRLNEVATNLVEQDEISDDNLHRLSNMGYLEAYSAMRDWAERNSLDYTKKIFQNKKQQKKALESLREYVKALAEGYVFPETNPPSKKQPRPSIWDEPSRFSQEGGADLSSPRDVNLVKDTGSDSYFSRLESTYMFYRPLRYSSADFSSFFLSDQDVLEAAGNSNDGLKFLSSIGIYPSDDHSGCLNSDLSEVDKSDMMNFKGVVYLHLAAIDPIISMGVIPDGVDDSTREAIISDTVAKVRGVYSKYFGEDYSKIITPEFVSDVLSSKLGGTTFLYSAVSKNASKVSQSFGAVLGQTRRKGHVKDFSDEKFIFDIKNILEDKIMDSMRRDGLISGHGDDVRWSLGVHPKVSYFSEDAVDNKYQSTDIFGSRSSAYSVIRAFALMSKLSPIDFVTRSDNYKEFLSVLQRPVKQMSSRMSQATREIARFSPDVNEKLAQVDQLLKEKNVLQQKEKQNPEKTYHLEIKGLNEKITAIRRSIRSDILKMSKEHTDNESLSKYSKLYSELFNRRKNVKSVSNLVSAARNSIKSRFKELIASKFSGEVTFENPS